jgi:hypothetical protein
LVPGLISLVLYVLLSFAIIPLYRRHRQRYSQYLPLETISQHTSSLRSRISDAIVRFILPSAWLHGRPPGGRYSAGDGDGDGDGSWFDEEEGEGLVGFDVDIQRRERLERSDDNEHSDRRLSRDLEEGFQDESEDEERRDDRSTVLR